MLCEGLTSTEVSDELQWFNKFFWISDMDDREKFWNSEESKEKERIADEKVRKKSEIKQLGMYIIYYLISEAEIWRKI